MSSPLAQAHTSDIGRPRRLHTIAAVRRRGKRDPHGHDTLIDGPPRHLSRRWTSTEFGGLADAAIEKGAAKSVQLRRVDASGEHISFDQNLLSKYPELELPKFLKALKSHKSHVLQESSKREVGGAGALKSLMRSMPHSTVLITALANEPIHFHNDLRKAKNLSPYSKHFRGAIVSSMTSVTLGPPAIISFNFREPSATLDGIRANRFFSLHFLKSDADGANVATQFLRYPRHHHAAWMAVSKDHAISVNKQINYRTKSLYAPQVPAAPMIQGPGIASHLVCEIMPDKCVSNLGDHSIIVAKVVSGPLYGKRDAEREKNFTEGFPPLLLYSEGRFKEHGSVIEESKVQEADTDAVEEQIAMREEGSHPDGTLKRQVVSAGEPDLYRAASSYMDGVLHGIKKSPHFPALKKLYTLMDSAGDRRAKFVAALKFWQFQQKMSNGGKGISDLGLQAFVDGDAKIVPTIMHDPRLKEIAEELVKTSVAESMGQDAVSWIGRAFKTVDKGRAGRERVHATRRRKAHTRDTALNEAAQPVKHFEGEEDIGFDVSIDDALKQAEAELKKHEMAQVEAEQKGSVQHEVEQKNPIQDEAEQKSSEQSPAY